MESILNDFIAQEPVQQAAPGSPKVQAPAAKSGAPEVVDTILQSVPGSARGGERVAHLIRQVRQLPDTWRQALRACVERWTRTMLELEASDMDCGGPACGGKIWFRVDGDKRRHEEMGTYTVGQTDVLFLNLLTEKQMDKLLEEYSVDFSFQLDGEGVNGRPCRFRATCYFDYDNLGLNMRAISDEVFPMEKLGFSQMIQHGFMFRHVRDGLTLITGVTGSGKSTTLDAVVDANNKDVPAHIVVIGKPIEYMHQSKNSIVRHREVGKDVPSFKSGIVQALRQDPDIIVIGEMRDRETISAALEVTDSGHKVFSTLHTSSAMETIDRIVAEYPSEEQERVRTRLADVLRCVVSQKLLPKLGGGRVMAKEVLWMTSSARAAIKNDNTAEVYQMMWEGRSQGMTTLEQDLFELAKTRQISPNTAMDFANNKHRLKQLFR